MVTKIEKNNKTTSFFKLGISNDFEPLNLKSKNPESLGS